MNFDEWWKRMSGKGCLLRGENEEYYKIAWEAATLAEREACAKVCETEWSLYTDSDGMKCAEAIRKRSNK